MFDVVIARFDGANFWFDQIDFNYDPEIAVAMREALADLIEPDKLNVPRSTSHNKLAYGIAYLQELEMRKDMKEERLKDAARRAGAKYRSYIDRGDTFTVEYTVDGERYTSTVSSKGLDVVTPGICLTDSRTGEDTSKRFDFQSLIHVIRQGQRQDDIYRV